MKRVMLVFIVFLIPSAYSDVHFIGGEKSDYFSEFRDSVLSSLSPDVSTKNNIYISIGSVALDNAIRNQYSPLLATHITRFSFKNIINGAGLSCPNCIGSVFWESDPKYQVELAKLLFTSGTIYILTSDVDNYSQSKRVKVLEFDGDILRSLSRIKSDAVAVVAVPDNIVYTPKNLRVIIRSLYSRKIPVIGYTKKMVDAGALVSVNSDNNYYSTIVSEALGRYWKGEDLRSEHVYPNVIHKNQRMARSLGIVIPDDLLEKIGAGDEK